MALCRCTKAGMIAALKQLIDAVNADPKCTWVWIHYSGHGSNRPDDDDDEVETDGRDEVIVSRDIRTTGGISDDEFMAILARFDASKRVVCVMDCCHSGTIGDLKVGVA
jgi:hypothetical protein